MEAGRLIRRKLWKSNCSLDQGGSKQKCSDSELNMIVFANGLKLKKRSQGQAQDLEKLQG